MPENPNRPFDSRMRLPKGVPAVVSLTPDVPVVMARPTEERQRAISREVLILLAALTGAVGGGGGAGVGIAAYTHASLEDVDKVTLDKDVAGDPPTTSTPSVQEFSPPVSAVELHRIDVPKNRPQSPSRTTLDSAPIQDVVQKNKNDRIED